MTIIIDKLNIRPNNSNSSRVIQRGAIKQERRRPLSFRKYFATVCPTSFYECICMTFESSFCAHVSLVNVNRGLKLEACIKCFVCAGSSASTNIKCTQQFVNAQLDLCING